jgi:hypothetical protein
VDDRARLMGLFDKIRPAYVTAPAEPPVPDEVRIADVDDRLTALARIPRADRSETWDAQVDRLLAMRAIRPAKPRPVVQGRVDSIIDNYWENP